MGVRDSQLRDRVIFVEGAPRSGTTWLVTLLATHPEIAGVQFESHLFDFATDRIFDNYEHRHPDLHGLWHFLDRPELVDLVRDFCDGVLIAMRNHVSAGKEPRFVVEKTPSGASQDGLDVVRKAECYPDAWYVHIVRDREAVTKSLMRAPFMPDRSYEACSEVWDRTVGKIRDAMGGLPRYREVSYEDLRADPGAACRELFEWLGASADENVLETVRTLSRESFSDLGVAAAGGGSRRSRGAAAVRGLKSRVGSAVDRLAEAAPEEAPDGAAAFKLVLAARERDSDAVRALTDEKFELVYRSDGRDEVLRDDPARDELVRLVESVFTRDHVGEWWASAGGPGEWWSSAPRKPVWTIFYSAINGDATRVDLAIALLLSGEKIDRAVVISAGPLSGRPVVSAGDAPP